MDMLKKVDIVMNETSSIHKIMASLLNKVGGQGKAIEDVHNMSHISQYGVHGNACKDDNDEERRARNATSEEKTVFVKKKLYDVCQNGNKSVLSGSMAEHEVCNNNLCYSSCILEDKTLEER